MWLHLLAVSLAANPRFDGNKTVIALVDQMWTAATTCTRRRARTHDVVQIRRQRDPRSLLPFDLVRDDAGVSRINVNRGGDPFDLANAIAEAWFPEGALALRMAMAEPLTECIAKSTLDEVSVTRRDLLSLDQLDDLREWTDQIDERLLAINPDLIVELTDDQRKAHYAASRRLGLVLAERLPRFAAYDPRLLEWPALLRALATVEDGAAITEMIEGGAKTQRIGLADPDRDGLLTIQEALDGTDPERWDTDGDGWWDGFDRPPDRAIPVSRDGSPACLTQVARSGSTTVSFGGRMRGVYIDEVMVTEMNGADLWSIPLDFLPGRGGHWIRAVGDDLVPNPNCMWTPRVTVRVVPIPEPEPTLPFEVGPRHRPTPRSLLTGITAEQLRSFAAEVDRVAALYEAALGPPRSRVHLELGLGEGVAVYNLYRAPSVLLPTKVARRVLGSESLGTSAAYLAMSLQRLSGRTAGAGHPATALLHARHMRGERVHNLVEILPDEVAVVRRQFEDECEDGWIDVFDGFCLDRIYAEEL